MIEKLKLNLDIVDRTYTETQTLLYHGEIKSKSTGFKYAVIYTNLARNKLYFY